MKFIKKIFKKKEKDPDALPFKTVIANNIWALRQIHRSAKGYIFAYLFHTVMNTLLDFTVYTLSLRFILNSFQSGSVGQKPAILLIVGLFLFQFLYWRLSDYFFTFFGVKMNKKIRTGLRRSLYEQACRVDYACYEDPKFYDGYVRAMDEANNRIFAVLDSVIDILSLVLNVILTGGLMISIDPVLLLFSIFPILFGLMQKKELQVYYKYVADQKPIDRKKNYIRRTFYLTDYAKEMRLSEMSESQIVHFKELYGDYKKVLHKYSPMRLFLGFVWVFSQRYISSVISMIYVTFRATVSHTMLIGDCTVIVSAIQNLSWELQRSVEMLAGFSEHALYIRDMRTFLNYQPKIEENPEGFKAEPGTIAFENVSFCYPGSKEPVLRDVSFTVGSEEVLAIVGCNGAGKSTLVKLLLRLYEPTEGRITLNGVDIASYQLSSYRSLFSAMYQDHKSFSMSVLDNVLCRPLDEQDRTLVQTALENSGIAEKVASLPQGMDTVLTKEFDPNGAVLSGGENQKIQLAAIFASGAHYAILDEPSSALDPIAEEKLFESMLKLTKGKSVIFISHRLSSSVLADKILVFDEGELKETGDHRTLMANVDGIYRTMFTKQAESYRTEEGEDEE